MAKIPALYRLGKKPAKHDPFTLKLAKYLLPSDELPTPPDRIDLSTKVSDWEHVPETTSTETALSQHAHISRCLSLQ